VKSRLLALAFTLGLLGPPLATPAVAAGVDAPGLPEAIVVVHEVDLPALLASGYVGEYAIVSPTEVGLDPDAILGPGLFGEESILTPTQLGIDTPQWGWWWRPWWRGVAVVGVGAPVFTFRSFVVTPWFPRFGWGGFGSPWGFTRVVVIR
jgi:hypothetical protein